MENRKRMYKAGPRENPTLIDRVKDNKNRRKNARIDTFANQRQILMSPGTPTKAQTKISGIVDRNQKLRAYRVAKNTKKFIEMQEQRSPFIVAVPTGRWVEKKERAPAVNFRLNDTPVRTAFASERILKRSTVKKLIAKSTAKKENVMVFGAQKGSPRPKAGKSKKQILAELNAVSQSNEVPVGKNDDTFEVLPDLPESPADPRPLRRSVSLPQIVSPPKVVAKPQKASTPPVKKVSRKEPAKKVIVRAPLVQSKQVVKTTVNKLAPKPLPAMTKVTTKAIAKKVEVTKEAAKVAVQKVLKPVRAAVAVKKPAVAAVIKKPVARPQKPAVETQPSVEVSFPTEAVAEVVAKPAVKLSKPVVKAKQPTGSKTYNMYKSSIHIQSSFLTMQISNVTANMDAYIELLNEDDQTFLHKTVQQGNLIVSEKLQKFDDILEKYEDGLKDVDNPKRLTDDDLENYWYLIYDEIEKLKEDLIKVLEKKKNALAIVASQKKRRTRRTYVPDEGTPKRSRRIAENVDTPKHNASCYGCVTMSATNTPKSTNKRRTTNKKSVLFDVPSETPKRSSRRSGKKSAATPKRSLIRMNALDDDDLDLELELI